MEAKRLRDAPGGYLPDEADVLGAGRHADVLGAARYLLAHAPAAIASTSDVVTDPEARAHVVAEALRRNHPDTGGDPDVFVRLVAARDLLGRPRPPREDVVSERGAGPPGRRPVSAGLRVDDRNPGHVRATVFVGRAPGARANAGQLTLRADEFDETFGPAAVGDTVELADKACLARLIAAGERARLRAKWVDQLGQDPATLDRVRKGWTTVCHECGSTRVATVTCHPAEGDAWDELRCDDCGQRG